MFTHRNQEVKYSGTHMIRQPKSYRSQAKFNGCTQNLYHCRHSNGQPPLLFLHCASSFSVKRNLLTLHLPDKFLSLLPESWMVSIIQRCGQWVPTSWLPILVLRLIPSNGLSQMHNGDFWVVLLESNTSDCMTRRFRQWKNSFSCAGVLFFELFPLAKKFYFLVVYLVFYFWQPSECFTGV